MRATPGETLRRRAARLPRPVRALALCIPLTIVVAALVFRGLSSRFLLGSLDTAGFADLLQRDAPNFALISRYFASFVPFWDVVLQPPPFQCADVLATAVADGNVWRGHACAIMGVLGLVVRVTGLSGATVGLLALAVSVSGALVALGAFLALRGVRLLWTVAFIALVAAWPVFSEGLFGQPYFDRLFFGPAAVVVLGIWAVAHRRAWAAWPVVAAIIVAATLVERAALVIGLLAVLYPVLLLGRRTLRVRAAWIVMLAGGAALAWAAIWERAIHYFAAVAHGSVLAHSNEWWI